MGYEKETKYSYFVLKCRFGKKKIKRKVKNKLLSSPTASSPFQIWKS
jgi:hypothetical protein